MKKKIVMFIILVLLLHVFIPSVTNAQREVEPMFPTQIKITRYVTYPSYELAPKTIRVQKWYNGVFYRGFIPKVSYIQNEPGKAIVKYEGYIPYDPSIIPSSQGLDK